MKTKVIAVMNQKGGVGKTTTTCNLGYALSKLGKDVLLIDFDSQASLSYMLNVGVDEERYFSVYDLLLKQYRDIPFEEDEVLAKMDFDELYDKTVVSPSWQKMTAEMVDGKRKAVYVQEKFGFDLIPSHLNLSDYELELTQSQNSGMRLANLIAYICKRHEYDYIIVDCNPSLGVLTMNAIIAAIDGIIIPTNLDLLSIKGVSALTYRIAEVQMLLKDNMNLEHMGVIGIILNLYSNRRVIDKEIEKDMNRFYPFKIFDSTIPESVDAKKAVYAGKLYSQKNRKAEKAYIALATELEDTIEKMKQEGQKITYIGDDHE